MPPPSAAAGFAGLGTAGCALSAHLLAEGWRVAGCDTGPARLASHTGQGYAAALARDHAGGDTACVHAVPRGQVGGWPPC